MKPLTIIFFLTLTSHIATAQYKIDYSIKKEFDSLYAQQKKAQKPVRYYQDGVAIITELSTEILNKEDYLSDDLNEFIEGINESDREKKPWFISQADKIDDTLIITSSFGFFWGMALQINFFENNAIVKYFEHDSGLDDYKNNLEDEANSNIELQTQIQNLFISEVPSAKSKKVYGKVTVLTAPYYVDDGHFKSGYMHKQLKVSYYFMCDLSKAKTIPSGL